MKNYIFDVVGLGLNSVDLLCELNTFPAFNSKSELGRKMKKRFGARTLSPFSMAALLFLFMSVTSAADDIHKKAGTAAAAFLKIDAGSRPMGMWGAFTGLADDINTLFWNPA